MTPYIPSRETQRWLVAVGLPVVAAVVVKIWRDAAYLGGCRWASWNPGGDVIDLLLLTGPCLTGWWAYRTMRSVRFVWAPVLLSTALAFLFIGVSLFSDVGLRDCLRQTFRELRRAKP